MTLSKPGKKYLISKSKSCFTKYNHEKGVRSGFCSEFVFSVLNSRWRGQIILETKLTSSASIWAGRNFTASERIFSNFQQHGWDYW